MNVVTRLMCTDRGQHETPVDLGYRIIDRRTHLPGCIPEVVFGSWDEPEDDGTLSRVDSANPKRLRHDGDHGVTYQFDCSQCQRTPRRREENLHLTDGARLDRFYVSQGGPGKERYDLDVSWLN